jgi:hypothetical protein
MPQLAQCLGFDLPNPLTCYVELLANLFKRMVGVHIDAESHAQHFRFAWREAGEYRMRGFLQALLAARVAEMRKRLAQVGPLIPAANAAYQARLAERMREALGAADDERLRAELAVFAVKTDVAEEL